jgi:shikimate kinase
MTRTVPRQIPVETGMPRNTLSPVRDSSGIERQVSHKSLNFENQIVEARFSSKIMEYVRHFKNIALVGFMGTGKSTVGQLVAEALRFEFIDTDAKIEERAGKNIAQIFATEGESRFREMESNLVQELSTEERYVISTGGGLVVNPENLSSLRDHCLIICLWASAETIWQRVRHQTHRPLLQSSNPAEKIRTLLKERTPAYKKADTMITTELRSPREVAMQVLKQFSLARKALA